MALVNISLDLCSNFGWVYFIQMEDFGPIKIGYATNVSGRLGSLQTGNPYKLKLLYQSCGTQTDEKQLHSMFHNWHIRGEWFHPAEKIFEYIKECKEFDLKTWERGYHEDLKWLGWYLPHKEGWKLGEKQPLRIRAWQ